MQLNTNNITIDSFRNNINLSVLFSDHPNISTITEFIKNSRSGKLHLTGLSGSSSGLTAAMSFLKSEKNMLAVINDKEEAAYFYNDLLSIAGADNILFFPSSYKRSVQYNILDNENIILRTEVLNKLISEADKFFIVTYPEALVETVASKAQLDEITIHLSKDEKISTEFLTDTLFEYGFVRNDFVYEPGQYAVRGSIVDVFSFSNDNPYRIDFLGDMVESIRTFDIGTQLSITKLDKVTIIPNIDEQRNSEKQVSFLDFIEKDTIIWLQNTNYAIDRINQIYENIVVRNNSSENALITQDKIIVSGKILAEQFNNFTLIEFGGSKFYSPDKIIEFHTSPQPSFNKNFDLLCINLFECQLDGYSNVILSENENQISRLRTIFNEINPDIQFITIPVTLHEGFTEHERKICCYTDHQIFERYHKFKLKTNFSGKEAITVKEICGLQPGDYVVHIDHGIGIFGGLEKIENNGRVQEAIRLIYKDNDLLYVNIHSLHRISRYKGKEGEQPRINKLGSDAWNRLKQATKKKVKDIAKDLILLYATRKAEKGFCFSTDSYLNRELEASFIYEDTPDQVSATQAVKHDMESENPMDRLICGDVGFGKTEVAIRAAFKAVCDSKQVAILVPTTILALQHYNTFSERLNGFPCTVEHISRLKKSKQQKQILKSLAEGKIDIIIGTHRLVSKDIKFKDIGLLIIDEEQKFGVAVKEKLKVLRTNIDTLILTATPIPRTLQFSLMGARDLSIINTPPPNRYPVTTELHTFNEDIIREAINYEIERGGQVFFVNNRIENICEIQTLLNKLCPKVSTVVAHGQMEGENLERIMLGFIAGQYDVLIATSIIENGLDIPNVNTIIINEAHHYGLSDLHQLRGRVGRSNRKAFCYLLAPPLTMVSADARRRLKAIEEFSELSSGFNIALQDLDIRGAGNLLGAEQSGFIANIGFDAYQRILNEAIQELKDNELKELFSSTKHQANDSFTEQVVPFTSDCIIDTDMELLFPDEYISNISERMRIYKDLDNILDETKLAEFENQLKDRFGELPEQSKELLNVVRLRRLAKKSGFEKIILKHNKFIGHFISNPISPFYQSSVFENILQFIQKQPNSCQMSEKSGMLTLTINNISNINRAIIILESMSDSSFCSGAEAMA
ncbi:MAG: transcription-repair coupling factor [Bacteroidia bacterium]|nr:transcription-repair coupling factor [Bacteroidia bacterium]